MPRIYRTPLSAFPELATSRHQSLTKWYKVHLDIQTMNMNHKTYIDCFAVRSSLSKSHLKWPERSPLLMSNHSVTWQFWTLAESTREQMTKGTVAIAKLVILIRSLIIKLHLTVVGRYSEIHLSITVLGGSWLTVSIRIAPSQVTCVQHVGTSMPRYRACWKMDFLQLKKLDNAFSKNCGEFSLQFLCLHLFTGIASFHSFFASI